MNPEETNDDGLSVENPPVEEPRNVAAHNDGDDDIPENYVPTARERKLMDQAVSREKTKLYAEKNDLKTELRKLRKDLDAVERNNPPTRAKRQSNDDSRDELLEKIDQLQERIDKSERKIELNDYRRSLIEEARNEGIEVIEAMIKGDSREELEDSFEESKREAARLVRKYNKPTNPVSQPEIPTTTVRRTAARPEGLPSAPRRPATVESDGQNGVMSVSDLKSLGGRNWGNNREKVLQDLKDGKIR